MANLRSSLVLLAVLWIEVIAGQRQNVSPGEALFLTPLIESNQIDEARQRAQVTNLFGNDTQNTPCYSGYLTVNKEYNSNLFFVLFSALTKQANPPLLLWLNGGPGYSSLYGLFNENGPYVVTKDLKLLPRKYSWVGQFSILYIDQPVGAGFSFTSSEKGFSRSLTDSSKDLYEALKQFFSIFREYRNSEFYITGESYAGKYIPGIAHQIHINAAESRRAGINLRGIAIGNGLVDPRNQMLYGEYLYNVGLIDEQTEKYFKEQERKIKGYIDQKKYMKAYRIWDTLMLGELNNGSKSIFENSTGFTYRYNILYNTAPPEFKYYERFVVQNQTRAAIHVGNRPFDGNSFLVETHLFEDFMTSAAPYVEELLDANYRVLLFSGALDIIIPTVTTENMIRKLKWKGAKKYALAPRKIYRIAGDKQITGYVKQAGNFTMVTVRNAGHVVPYERPEVAFDMIHRFVNQANFTDRF